MIFFAVDNWDRLNSLSDQDRTRVVYFQGIQVPDIFINLIKNTSKSELI